MNFRYYWSIFLRRLPYFLVVASVIGAASVIIAMALPPAYVSSMKLIVESPRIPDELAASTVRTPAPEQLQIIEQRLLTRANLLEIANRQNVFEDPSVMTADRIVAGMQARTVIKISTGRNEVALMEISFEGPSGASAAGVLNEYLTLIQKEDVQSRTGRATQTLEFFRKEVDRLSEALAERSAQILDFKTKNVDVLPDTLDFRLNQQALLQERLAQLNRDLAVLNSQRSRLIDIYETTGQVSGNRTPNQTPEQLELVGLRRELNQALAIYSTTNPRVKLLEARIKQLEEQAGSMPQLVEESEPQSGNLLLDVQLAELDSRIAASEEQKNDLSPQLDELRRTINQTPEKQIRLDDLELDYQHIERQYNAAVESLARASTGERIEVTAQGQRVSVIEPPIAPSSPTKPNRMMIAGGGSLFGILAGIGLIALLELLNRTLRRPEDLVAKLDIRPLATIPYIPTSGEVMRFRVLRLLRMFVIVVGVPAAVYAVHVFYQPLDLLAERVMDKIGIRW
ncbi:GumC family protein [Ruegeria atlantica]|uniref:Polysaccharide chain length determinant protein, PEP-CTERM locus subfamily n=1 Tax=Ruegeria atlantica TaxID=81569 RepID=A0A0N7LQV3_9RHOB|nr:lipopolysaccharide biosynthesis [Ruegeria atlantica]CUH49060.1 polysaccharide chain length determinant protein, PEP-CTERM locus subfamily [Ruegeria atlantica]